MEFDDKYYETEIYGKLNIDAQSFIENIAKENQWSIAKATRFFSKLALEMQLSKFESENNGLN
jgi:hypothetical protein